MRVADNFPFDAVRPLLDEREQGRAARLRFIDDRNAFAAAHALLRHGLARVVGAAHPWQFETLAGGKPVLSDGPWPSLHFSLSHSRGMAAVAIADCAPVGVDVEATGRILRGDGVSRLVLAPVERVVVDAAPTDDGWRDAFFSFWTLKEAVIKATGQGLAVDLGGFALGLAPPRLLTPGPDGSPPAAWHLDARVLGGHRLAAAVCAPAGGDVCFRCAEVTTGELLNR